VASEVPVSDRVPVKGERKRQVSSCFTYLVVNVKDMERSLSLYRDLLGMEVGFFDVEADGTRVAFVVPKGKRPMSGATMLELVTVPEDQPLDPAGFIIGIEVDWMAETTARLREAGYELGDPYTPPGEGYLNVDFVGPDGEVISLMEVDWAIAPFHKPLEVTV
jgi:catechol 2,3-dioxygenase-like lactoylglutathione lyase family enzyme